MARYTASNSWSKVLYLVSAGDNFLEKYESGVHCPLMNCCRTAPTAVFEASVMMLVGAFATGWLTGWLSIGLFSLLGRLPMRWLSKWTFWSIWWIVQQIVGIRCGHIVEWIYDRSSGYPGTRVSSSVTLVVGNFQCGNFVWERGDTVPINQVTKEVEWWYTKLTGLTMYHTVVDVRKPVSNVPGVFEG